MAIDLRFLRDAVTTSSQAIKAMSNFNLGFHSSAKPNPTEVDYKLRQLDNLNSTITAAETGRYNRPTNKL